MEKFAEERKLLRILREEIIDRPRWFEEKSRVVKFQPFITPTVEFNPVTGTVPPQYEEGRKAVSHKDLIDFIVDAPLNNDDAVYVVPAATPQVRLVQINSEVVAIGVAARAMTITITKLIAGVGLIDAMVTGAVALTDAQIGTINMFQNGPTWLNDNGVITNEDTNITGAILQTGDIVTVTWTNKDADDRGRLMVGVINLPVV